MLLQRIAVRLKSQEISFEQKLWEFDVWVTPSIVDIRKTARFRLELERILAVLDALSAGGHRALDPGRFSADLVDRVLDRLDGFAYVPGTSPDESLAPQVGEFLASLSALLFLVTGKSDNNNKCQFPIFLRNTVGWATLPGVRFRRRTWEVVADAIPRVLDSEAYMSRVGRLYAAGRSQQTAIATEATSLRDLAAQVLFPFVDCLLADEASRDQLTAFLQHYSRSRESGEAPEPMLVPIVMFQVRGSVAASGGHEPEEILRARMEDWGLARGIDFNTADVVLDAEAGLILDAAEAAAVEPNAKTKTRAYDFVLPYRTPTWTPRIFVQSQFYAGDSGSVSHKNVDQTHSSRITATKLIAKKWPDSPLPCFLEYVDGAGYSASLNGDLKSLLSYQDTAGFFQIRSAPIRLRRHLQQIGFLTPMEVAHAVLRCGGLSKDIVALLLEEGYTEPEITRAIGAAESRGVINRTPETAEISVDESILPMARQYLILDMIAREGAPFPSLAGIAGVVLVPGYGPYYGLALSEVARLAKLHFSAVWPESFMADLEALCTAGFVVLR